MTREVQAPLPSFPAPSPRLQGEGWGEGFINERVCTAGYGRPTAQN
jgi:hypothetical protein